MSSGRHILIPDDWEHSSYSTHWHLILTVMLRFKPRTILETGSGKYSTNLFRAFDIDRLVSLENNRTWFRNTEDPRHEFVTVKGRIVDNLPDLKDFDLVFVDDDPVEERLLTIKKVLKEATGLVVIHDTNHPPIHTLIANRPNHTDTSRGPTTTVLHPAKSKEFTKWLNTR